MKKHLLFIYVLFLIAGCTHGLIGTLPAIDDPDEAAEIIVIRESKFHAGGRGFKIFLDGAGLFVIRNGEYTRFHVASGKHSLAFARSALRINMIINVLCKPKGTYYFLVSPATIEPLEEARGLYLISKSNLMPLEQ